MSRRRVTVLGTMPIAAPPAAVWQVFADVPRWREWDWLGLADAGWVRGDAWAVGSVIRVGHRPFTFDCRLVRVDPPRAITWSGGGMGVDAHHTYRFLPHPGGCLVVSEETFAGRLARTILPLVRWYWHHHLRGLKRAVEEGRRG